METTFTDMLICAINRLTLKPFKCNGFHKCHTTPCSALGSVACMVPANPLVSAVSVAHSSSMLCK